MGSIPIRCTILKHITGRVVGGGSPTKDASPTKKFIVCFNMVETETYFGIGPFSKIGG